MKIQKIIFVSVLALAPNLFSAEVSSNKSQNMKLSDYYQAIDTATMNKSTESLIRLLNELEACREVTFGNGYGPTNNISLQIIILDLINDISRRTVSSTSISASKNDQKTDWNIFLETRKDDIDGILRMLKSPNAAVRYLGISKLDSVPSHERVIKELQKIVNGDPYIIIAGARRSMETTNELPYNGKIGAHLESAFCAPLREKAIRQLKVWGISADIDQNKLCYDGIMMLAKLYEKADRRLKGEIIESLKMFSSDTLPIKILFDLNQNKIPEKYIEIINEFRNELMPRK